jgi:UDP-glucose 4-epimerase
MSKGLVLVTGGGGFIGRAVCKLLQREGYRALPIEVPPEPETVGGPIPEIKEIPCDIRRATHLWMLFQAQPIDSIIHLAAILPTVAQKKPLLATQTNITGTMNLLEMARQFKLRRMIFASSLSVYGTYSAEEVVTETHRTAPEDVYGATKLCAEQAGSAYSAQFGVPFVSLRIGRVVGAGAASRTSAWRSQIFEDLRSDEGAEISLPYAGTEGLLITHVDDIARMLVTLLEAPKPECPVYNAVSEEITVAELKKQVESLNPKIQIKLGAERVKANPQRLDSSRFRKEFGFTADSLTEHLKRAAGK